MTTLASVLGFDLAPLLPWRLRGLDGWYVDNVEVVTCVLAPAPVAKLGRRG